MQAFGGVPGAMHVDPKALVFTASWTVTSPILTDLKLQELAVTLLNAQSIASTGCVFELALSAPNVEVHSLLAGVA